MYLSVREKKNCSFEIIVIILRYIYITNVNFLFKKDFKIAKLLTKTSVFLYFRDCPKTGWGNKEDVKSICARVTKPASKKVAKAEFDLNWLWTNDYGFFWLYIHIHDQFSLFCANANVLTGFMISLFLEVPAQRVRGAWKLMGASVRNGLSFFLLFGKKYYFFRESWVFLLINFSETFF